MEALQKYGGIHAEEHWKAFLEKLSPVYELASEIECAEQGIAHDRDCIGVSPALRASAEESAEAVTELSRRLSVDFVSRSLDMGMKMILAASKESDAEHISEWLRENRLSDRPNLSIRNLSIPCGIVLPEQKIVFLTERELFPAVLRGKDRVRSETSQEEDIARASAGELENMADIEEGDLTVHLNYGLCRYRGLKNVKSGGSSIESLVLEFDDDAMVYVPVWQAHLVSRYVGSHVKGAQLSKLGSSRWAKAREEAASSARNPSLPSTRTSSHSPSAMRRSSLSSPPFSAATAMNAMHSESRVSGDARR